MFAVRTKEPLNALMAGTFCSLGMFALSGKFNKMTLIASLRVQLSDKKTYSDYDGKRALKEFVVTTFLLFLAAFCLIN